MKIGIVVFPPKSVQDVANDLRKRYDPHYSLIQPHITLQEATATQEDELDQLSVFLGKVSTQAAPFEVTLNRISNFYPTNHVIYFALSDPKPMSNLQKLIHTGPLDIETPYSYIPHLTVGQKMAGEELHDVYASLKKMELDLTFKVDRFHLLFQTENAAWTVHQTFLLGQK